eukprot:m.113496 g.113496  ORF g.113496 m.113496 type:complete len:90 (+) comp28275_c0_seq1:34-303(+)
MKMKISTHSLKSFVLKFLIQKVQKKKKSKLFSVVKIFHFHFIFIDFVLVVIFEKDGAILKLFFISCGCLNFAGFCLSLFTLSLFPSKQS